MSSLPLFVDSHSEDPNADTIHISEEPRREHELPLDEGGQQFTISLNGISVAHFYAFRGVLYQVHAKRFKVLGPTDSWIFGELILTNQGGTWVLTAPSNSPLLLAYGRLSTEECAQLDSAKKNSPLNLLIVGSFSHELL